MPNLGLYRTGDIIPTRLGHVEVISDNQRRSPWLQKHTYILGKLPDGRLVRLYSNGHFEYVEE